MPAYVGQLVAEGHLEQCEYLPRTFIETPSIRRVLNGRSCFVCGRRGSGKTAIATMLDRPSAAGSATPHFQVSCKVVRDDYDVLHATMVDELQNKLPNTTPTQMEQLYYHLWRYILEILLCRLALASPAAHAAPSPLSAVQAYLDNAGFDDHAVADTVTTQAISLLGSTQSDALPFTALILSIKHLRKSPAHLAATRAALLVLENFPSLITIDSREIYDLRGYGVYPLQGMCRAVRACADEVSHRNIRILCFLPAELTEDLFRENHAKYYEVSEYLYWSYADLLQLLAHRMCYFLDQHDHSAAAEAIRAGISEPPHNMSRSEFWRTKFWHLICEPRIRNRLGWSEDSCAYLIRHTQKRPREVISCMNHVLDLALDRNELPVISGHSLRMGIHSDGNTYQLLSDNLSTFTLPKSDLSVPDVAGTVMAGEHTVFSGRDFTKFAKRALQLLSTSPEADCVADAKQLLLRSGLIGRVIPAAEGIAHEWHEARESVACKYYVTEFEYLRVGHISINDQTTCGVHPILSNRLGLTGPENDSGVIYPLPEADDLIGHFSTEQL